MRITCRTIFTDPNVHQELHDNHVELFSTYFGYWYKQDLFAYNSQLQSVLTNSLIEVIYIIISFQLLNLLFRPLWPAPGYLCSFGWGHWSS